MALDTARTTATAAPTAISRGHKGANITAAKNAAIAAINRSSIDEFKLVMHHDFRR